MEPTLTELRIDVPDHPGALAAVARELAALGANVVEVAIHEVDGPRAVDEIVVTAPATVTVDAFAAAVSGAGAALLSARTCAPRLDAAVAALTWVTEVVSGAGGHAMLQRAVGVIAGISPVQVVPAATAITDDVTAAALRRGRPVVQRVDVLPAFVTASPAAAGGRWLLAAPDRAEGELVVVATRPFSVRFTATELRRLAAVLSCYDVLARASVVPA